MRKALSVNISNIRENLVLAKEAPREIPISISRDPTDEEKEFWVMSQILNLSSAHLQTIEFDCLLDIRLLPRFDHVKLSAL